MVRKPRKIAVKEKQGRRFLFFLVVSLVFHSMAAMMAPALIEFYDDQPAKIQGLSFVDIIKEKNAPPAERAHARKSTAATRAISTPAAPPDEKPAPKDAPGPDLSAARAAGPLKSSDTVRTASLEKDVAAPGAPGGLAHSGYGPPEDAPLPTGGKGAGKAMEAADADDIADAGEMKTYDDGDPLLPPSGMVPDINPAPVFSSVTGIGPAFTPAKTITAEGTVGKSGAAAGADGITAARIEKAAGAGPAFSAGIAGMDSPAGNAVNGDNIANNNKKTAPAGTLYASLAMAPGGALAAGQKKSGGMGAIKTLIAEAAGFGHPVLKAVPEAGIDIKSPSDGSVIDCLESADITVAGVVKGKVNKVTVYVNGASYEASASNGSFKIRVPAMAEKNFIHAEGYDIYGDRCVSRDVTCMIKNLDPVDMAVYCSSAGGGKLKLRYSWRPYPIRGKGGKERANEFNISDGDNQRILTVAAGARGIYTIGIENESDAPESAEVRVCLFPRDPGRKRVRRFGTISLGGGKADSRLVSVLLPDGVFWDDNGWFSGMLESTRATIKYKQPEGIEWEEDK